jgi:hypothetical protein
MSSARFISNIASIKAERLLCLAFAATIEIPGAVQASLGDDIFFGGIRKQKICANMQTEFKKAVVNRLGESGLTGEYIYAAWIHQNGIDFSKCSTKRFAECL